MKNELEKWIRTKILKTVDENNKIKLSSGKYTRYYFDIRSVSSTWYFSKLIAYSYDEIIKDLDNRFSFLNNKNKSIKVGGLESGAIPIIMSLVHEYQIDGFYVRKQRKDYGMRQQIEGLLSDDVFIVDDIVTTGSSVLKCVNALREAKHDINIIGVYPLIDRTKELLNDTELLDVMFHSLLKDLNIEYKPIFSSLDFINTV